MNQSESKTRENLPQFHSTFSNTQPNKASTMMRLKALERQRQTREEMVDKSRKLSLHPKQPNELPNFDQIEVEEEMKERLPASTKLEEEIIPKERKTQRKNEEMSGLEEEFEEMDIGKKNKREENRKRRFLFLASQFQSPEFVYSLPEDINSKYWVVCAKPDGERCMLVAHEGSSYLIDKNGYIREELQVPIVGG